MTISLLQMQIQRLLHCNATVYIHHSLAGAFNTLRDAGLEENVMIEHPIDETLSLREFEEELEEKFNFSLELCNKDSKPFTNKSLRLFQITPCSNDADARQLDISLELLARQGKGNSQQNRAV
ncbi:hypothetical protein EGT74_11135 [Chitinophaga lutea]|uniref:Uncharacterized protein n=1 Tax=Chitinophaga lutea TaxID=2488634 RepID=A0A3N4PZ01_9BACT|nr:hypothetical protein [Chitinophaga lutea]RPE14033.1 hypothetical protein EGT74_11135 [Chitinophaga lutea]